MRLSPVLVPFVLTGACADSQENAGPPPTDGPSTIPDASPDESADVADRDARCANGWCVVEDARFEQILLSVVWGTSASDVWMAGSKGTAVHWNGNALEARPPTPDSVSYRAIGGVASDDVWLLADADAAFHFTRGPDASGGTATEPRWVKVPLGPYTAAPVNAVIAAGPNDVYALTDQGMDIVSDEFGNKSWYAIAPAVWHWTNAAWTAITPTDPDRGCRYFDPNSSCPVYQGGWASGGEVWLAADLGRLFRAHAPTGEPPRANIELFETLSTSTFRSMSGSSADDIWAVGAGGTARHWRGATWDVVSVPSGASLNAVWARAADDVWIVGEGGTALHGDGHSFEREELPKIARDRTLYGAWGPSKDETWIVGERVLLHRTTGGAP